MLAWTKQNTMQRAIRTVLVWPQSHAIRKTINMLTNKYDPQQKCRLGTVSKKLLGEGGGAYAYMHKRLLASLVSIKLREISR